MRIAWCLLAAAGCTTIEDGFALEIDALEAPVVVVKDGDGPWERVATTTDGRAFVQIYRDFYGVGALCSDEILPIANFIFDTQPRTVFLPCPVTPTTTAVHVRGTTAPMAEVWVGSLSTRADESGAYDLALWDTGLHDIVAIVPSAPPKIVAQRGVVIAGNTRVDLPATGAVEMTVLYPMVTGAERDAIAVSSDLNTSTDWVSFGSDPTTVYLPPPDFLVPTDRPAIAAHGNGCTRQHPLSAANEPIELPAPITYTLDRAQVTWSADPAVAWESSLVDIDSTNGRYMAYASASWREANATSSIPIVDLAALPGWTSDLPRLAADERALVGFSVSRGAFDGDLTSCRASAQLERW
ncbi:MAG: hypothetical protein ACKV2T_04925 [Kofleriaceae bacterium]